MKRTFALILLSLTSCNSPALIAMGQNAGIVPYNSSLRAVKADPDGEGCSGGLGLPPGQMIRECNEAMAAQQTLNAQRQQEQYDLQTAQNNREQETDNAKYIRIQSHASNELIHFETEITPLSRAYGVAMAAVACNIRSIYWFTSFETSVFMAESNIESEFSLSKDEGYVGREFSLFKSYEERNKYLPPLHTNGCSSLIGSPELMNVDQMQWRATGGYH